MIFCNCIFLMFLTYLIPQKISAAKNDHTKYFWAQSAQENGSDTEENGTGSGSKIKLSYKNNLLLKSVRNAEKLNATCLVGHHQFTTQLSVSLLCRSTCSLPVLGPLDTCFQDGSKAKFYISRRPNSPYWLIHLQAGGSCITQLECEQRSVGPLGSSVFLDEYISGEYTLAEDPKINPTFYSWNKVFIPYCSGDVFVGRMPKKRHPFKMPMLGHYIVVAIIKQLIQDYQINRNGAKILFGGTSAGGLGVMANIDLVQKLTYPAEVRGYNDGGWFTLFPNYGEEFFNPGLPKFFDILTKLFERYWDGYVDESCRAQMPKAAACLYGELALKHLKAPMYVMVAQWDSYQLTRLIADDYRSVSLPPKREKEKNYLSQFGNFTYRSISRLIKSTDSGVFFPACYCHTFLTSCIEGNICQFPPSHIYTIRGQTAYGALSEWHLSNGKRGTYVEIPQEEPTCNPTCCSLLCDKCQLPRRTKRLPEKSHDTPSKRYEEKINRVYYYYYSKGIMLQGAIYHLLFAILLINWTVVFIFS